ncbi:hypothetical protein [Flavobacterium ovatum]|uniref:hypothetical protein n=1 Tax=Flavobacterium ovatum TaxID=1928857 RepID=UPI00344DC117
MKSCNYEKLQPKFEIIEWQYALNETYINLEELGTIDDYESEQHYLKEKKWYSKQIKKANRIIDSNLNQSKMFAVINSTVWLGVTNNTVKHINRVK